MPGRGISRPAPSDPNMTSVWKNMFCTSSPKPKVASARYRPEWRIAETARTMPTGTTASPARMSAKSHGTPASSVKRENTTAPMAENVTWHRDTWPDERRRSPRDRNRITCVSIRVHWLMSSAAKAGASTSTTSTSRPIASWARNGARHVSGRRWTATSLTASRDRGERRRIANSTMNGRLAGIPPMTDPWPPLYLVAIAVPTPIAMPPT